jgi:putative SOS response-associated peptidase YedK
VASELGAGRTAIQRPVKDRRELSTFRGAFAKRRAIIPATAFFEWRRRKGRPKQPFTFARIIHWVCGLLEASGTGWYRDLTDLHAIVIERQKGDFATNLRLRF